jgi:S-methylmethionine-dependent homocysteine/selenocysteine methylase
MSYKNVEKVLSENGVVILDGGIGAELERLGAPMDGILWCGRCSIENPDLVRQVHESYVIAGADVITANTYATPPTAMKEAGLSDLIEEWNIAGVKLAREIANNSSGDIAVAGSLSTYGSWQKLGVKELRLGFDLQGKVLADAGVDLIILETLASEPEIVEAAIESANVLNLPIWLSISCAVDRKNDNLMHGVQESINTNSNARFFKKFSDVIADNSRMHDGPILVMHSDLKVTNKAVQEISENHSGIVGAYPNAGYWIKPNWQFLDEISPDTYLVEAESWIANGAQIIGGCCGVGPELIQAISHLKEEK